MFGGLFKSKEETSTSMTNKEVLKDKLWNSDIRWFLYCNKLSTNVNDYSTNDLINIKKAIEEKRKRNTEENHKKLYEILKDNYGYEPTD